MEVDTALAKIQDYWNQEAMDRYGRGDKALVFNLVCTGAVTGAANAKAGKQRRTGMAAPNVCVVFRSPQRPSDSIVPLIGKNFAVFVR